MDTQTKHAGVSPAYNTQPAGLEKKLDEVFYKKAPFQLPAGLTKWLADNSWWIVLVGAVLSLFAIYSTYTSMTYVAQTSDLLGAYGYGYDTVLTQSKNMLYVSMLSSAIGAVLLFMASSKLKVHEKAGWNLLYYNFLLNLAVTVVGTLVFAPASFLVSVIGFAIGFVIGAYILFQLRPRFAK
jgi:mannitol-specific phosphotransferase system IIBC component